MKVIFSGTIVDGLGAVQLVADEAAEDLVIARLANGILAEAIDLQDPAILKTGWKQQLDGLNLVAFGTFAGGMAVFGPFNRYEAAEEFAEQSQDANGKSDTWVIFVLPD